MRLQRWQVKRKKSRQIEIPLLKRSRKKPIDGHSIQDPHFWFDIDLYKEAVKNAAAKLQELLPEEKEEIGKNLDAYLEKLTELDEENKKMLAEIPEGGRYLITPQFPSSVYLP